MSSYVYTLFQLNNITSAKKMQVKISNNALAEK